MYEKYIRKLDDNEIIICGDIDEIPNSDNINHFKYCQVNDSNYSFQFWSTFYIYGFNYLFESDSKAQDDPYSLPYPNLFRALDIRRIGKYRGVAKAFLLPRASGCHGFTISLYKDMSQSDSQGLTNFQATIILNSTVEACNDIKRKFSMGLVYEFYFPRIKLTNTLLKHEKIFIRCTVLSIKYAYKQYIS